MTNDGSNGAAAAAASGWLGFSLSAPHMVDAHQHHHNQQQSHGGLFYPSPAAAAAAYGLGSGDVGAVNTSLGYYSPQLASMPLKSDGSLCIMEALRRTSDNHHHQDNHHAGGPKLEDFLGAAGQQQHALSLDNSSTFYYYGGAGNANANGGHQGFLQQQAYDVYGAAAAAEEESAATAAAMASWVQASQAQLQLQQHPLALSMSSGAGSLSSCVTLSGAEYGGGGVVGAGAGGEGGGGGGGGRKRAGTAGNNSNNSKQQAVQHRKSIDTFGQRTSQYRGVTRHRWTGRYEAHLWDNSCKKEGQTRKGRQVYLGGYDMEEKAARAYDQAALKYWGPSTHINFPLEDYAGEVEEMKKMSRQEYVAHLRRKSSGFSRGASMYRGVTRHHQHGRWQARIGRVSGNKDLYLGTFGTQEEAAEAYDIAAIKFRGLNAVTNFDITRYHVDKIIASNTLLPAELAKRNPSNDPDPNSTLLLQDDASAAIPAPPPAHDHQTNAAAAAAFSAALHDLVAVQGGNGNGNVRMAAAMSAAAAASSSSLVTSSLSNSRGDDEISPDRAAGGLSSMLFAAKQQQPKLMSASSWAASSSPASARPAPAAVSIAHMPMFAAWGDA
ncbi:AP2-like ethylene-responsive transcription factor ANT isoform X1 [Brachypodium distachyon]|uniref:AP2/ERF domain-containing protein n=1 Tax=Brachypodium distachyon TaxID=15368 RepID=A0A2K2DS34_BRADI|nr:AP2-like ethylene-responsive transcription factor ANT isoform X1 [Brachypodium distachyon]PNT77083.1 hypothetical protein BRADI_1g57560v3 [Brachypodium distachyon]|eukprot:XP_014757387.1 AP2-like ethylene-responsive transcription factor ANT isoform X1 [Brachypodium distachyon]